MSDQSVMQLTERLSIVMRARRSPGPLIARCETRRRPEQKFVSDVAPRTMTGATMSYRDPYGDRGTNSDPYSDPYSVTDHEPRIIRVRSGGLSAGSIVGAFVAIVAVAAVMIYAINRTVSVTAGGPSTTQSAPSATGQGGGTAPAAPGQ